MQSRKVASHFLFFGFALMLLVSPVFAGGILDWFFGKSDPINYFFITQQVDMNNVNISCDGNQAIKSIDNNVVTCINVGGSSYSNHDDLNGLQGGTVGEYYHSTQAQNNIVSNLTDANFNICSGATKTDGYVVSWNDTNKCNEYVEMQGGGEWFDSLPYSKSLAELIFSSGWMGTSWDAGFSSVAVDTNLETQGHTFWLREDANISTISVYLGSNNTTYGDINLVVYDVTRSTGYPNQALCWTNTTRSGVASANNYNDWNFATGSCSLTGGQEYVFQMYNKNATPATYFFQVQYLDNAMFYAGNSALGKETRIYTANGTTWTRASNYANNFLVTFEDGNYIGLPLKLVSGQSFGQYGVTWWSPNFRIKVSAIKIGVLRSGTYTNTSGLEIRDVNNTVIAQSLNSYQFANYPTSLASPVVFYFNDVLLDANHGYILAIKYINGTTQGVGVPSADVYNFGSNAVKLKAQICGDYRCGYPYNGSVNWGDSYKTWVNPVTVFYRLYMGDTSDSVFSNYSGTSVSGLDGGLDSDSVIGEEEVM